MKHLLAAFCLFLAMPAPGFAQQGNVADGVTAATITTTSGNCLAQNNDRRSLTLDATGATTNIGYCEGASCTAVVGVTGTTTLAAGSLHYWPAGSAPKNAFCFISVTSSQPMTIREGK
jgi:hypothetical protein